MNILFLRVGSFSYLNHYLYRSMARHHNMVANIDAGEVLRRRSLQSSSLQNYIHTVLYFRKFWQQAYSKNSFAFSRMTQYCNRAIRSRSDYDVIFQTQCKFGVTENPYSRPYFIYTDLTQKLTDRLWDQWTLKSTVQEQAKWYRFEAEAFHRADKIFTFNSAVKSSFVADYHIPADKVVVVGAGVNCDKLDDSGLQHKDGAEIMLLFLCTDFERQGGAAVVEAFNMLKQHIPGVKLMIGGRFPGRLPAQAELHKNPTRDAIENLMLRATIFLMPGSLGGLQSVLEAMSKKCVCIVGATNVLLSEVIHDGETGITIQSNNAKQLAEQVIELYRNEAKLRKIASQAYQFVQQNYTWDHVVQRMTSTFHEM